MLTLKLPCMLVNALYPTHRSDGACVMSIVTLVVKVKACSQVAHGKG
jgi:hypothetical protein